MEDDFKTRTQTLKVEVELRFLSFLRQTPEQTFTKHLRGTQVYVNTAYVSLADDFPTRNQTYASLTTCIRSKLIVDIHKASI